MNNKIKILVEDYLKNNKMFIIDNVLYISIDGTNILKATYEMNDVLGINVLEMSNIKEITNTTPSIKTNVKCKINIFLNESYKPVIINQNGDGFFRESNMSKYEKIILNYIETKYTTPYYPDFGLLNKMFGLSIENLCDIIYLNNNFNKEKYRTQSNSQIIIKYKTLDIEIIYKQDVPSPFWEIKMYGRNNILLKTETFEF